MQKHIVDDALRAAGADALSANLKAIAVGLGNIKDENGKKVFCRTIGETLTKGVNLLDRRINDLKEKFIKHDLV